VNESNVRIWILSIKIHELEDEAELLRKENNEFHRENDELKEKGC
jgi:hypothetical protein